jgi:hypothetical protein
MSRDASMNHQPLSPDDGPKPPPRLHEALELCWFERSLVPFRHLTNAREREDSACSATHRKGDALTHLS